MESEAPQTTGTPAAYEDITSGGAPQQNPQVRARTEEEHIHHGTIVVKIGGSTLGSGDTTLQDVVDLQRQGVQAVVVHGGGKVITEWMARQGIKPRFIRGLRVTDERSLDIVVAVLTGLINKKLVASVQALGGKAMGISGADGGMLRAKIEDERLGLVGGSVKVDPSAIAAVLGAGCIPIVAPVAVDMSDGSDRMGSLLNINADTAAGEIAAALRAELLVFLTDVEGVLDSSRRLIPRLTQRQARGLMRSNVVAGGMVPKLEACLTALTERATTRIVDGRKPHVLVDVLSDKALGTRVG